MRGRWGLVGAATLLLACGGAGDPDGGGGVDAGPGVDAAGASCASADDCDDGLSCNGAERCMRGVCVAGAPLDCDDLDPCTIDRCVESSGECAHAPADRDGDGHGDLACGGDDCDDRDPDRFPGNTEVCDELSHDEDCDPETFGVRDADRDTHHDRACCNYASDGTGYCGADCDDGRRDAHPLAPEVCGDGVDNDCDDAMDEGLVVTRYVDADGDLHGDLTAPSSGCGTEAGYSVSGDDCDDTAAAVHLGATETCNARDDDCDLTVDEECLGCPPSTADDMWVGCSSDRCANTSRWVSDCGGCDRPCLNDHGDVTCVAGACVPVCASGYDDCNGVTRDGCETNLLDDEFNCGSCGTVCGRGEQCDRGTCSSCAELGLVDCEGSCVESDPTNCGICRTECVGETTPGVCYDLHCVVCSNTLLPQPEWITVSDQQGGELECPNMRPGETVRVTATGGATPNDPGDVIGRYTHFDLVISDGTVRSYRAAGGAFTLTADVVVPASGEISAYLQYIAAGWNGTGSGQPIQFAGPTVITIEDLP